MALQLLLVPEQTLDPAADGATILLELGFARAPGADATALAGQAAASAEQSWQPIAQLRQLHLQSPGGTAGPLGKNVENQFAAVGDRAGEQALQVAGLHGRQFPVGHHQRGTAAAYLQGGFLQLSGSPEGLGVGTAGALADHRYRACPGTAHKPFQFRQLALSAQAVAVREGQQQHPLLV